MTHTLDKLQDDLRRLKEGDKDAFHTVYEQTKDHVYRTVAMLVNNKQDVHDVISEVYAELFQSVARYDAQKPFRAWLTGIVIRQAHNWNRKLWRKFRLFERSKHYAQEDRTPGSEELLLQQEEQGELIRLVQKLPYKQRIVVVLRYYQQCAFEEIAEHLGIPVGTVKSRHHHALDKLRKHATINSIHEDQGGLAICPSKIN